MPSVPLQSCISQIANSRYKRTARYRQRWRGGKDAPWSPRRAAGSRRPSYRPDGQRGRRQPFRACRLYVSRRISMPFVARFPIRLILQIWQHFPSFHRINATTPLRHPKPGRVVALVRDICVSRCIVSPPDCRFPTPASAFQLGPPIPLSTSACAALCASSCMYPEVNSPRHQLLRRHNSMTGITHS